MHTYKEAKKYYNLLSQVKLNAAIIKEDNKFAIFDPIIFVLLTTSDVLLYQPPLSNIDIYAKIYSLWKS